LKILIYSLNFFPEKVGIGKYSGEMAFWLAKKGIEVKVITSNCYYPHFKINKNIYLEEKYENLTILRTPIFLPNKFNGINRIFHFFSFSILSTPYLISNLFWRPNIVFLISPTIICAPLTLIFSRLTINKIKTWIHIQDFEIDIAFNLGLIKVKFIKDCISKFESKIINKFDHVSTISRNMIKKLKYKKIRSDKLYLFPNWVDTGFLYPINKNKKLENKYRKELGIPDEAIIIMYSGSMNEKQGFGYIINAIKKIDSNNIFWIFGGEGPSKIRLQKATKKYKNVVHLNLQPNSSLNEWLNLGDIHLVPQKSSIKECALPSKILGIMSCGKPFVAMANANSELGKYANHGGIRVDYGNSDSFLLAIKRLIKDPQLREQLGRNGRKLVVEEFFIDNILKKFITQTNQLIKS